MKIEKFSYHFELAPTMNFQKATVGITVDCLLEPGDDYEQELARVKDEVRKEIGREALSALDALCKSIANKRSDV